MFYENEGRKGEINHDDGGGRLGFYGRLEKYAYTELSPVAAYRT